MPQMTKEELLLKLTLQYKDAKRYSDSLWKRRIRNLEIYMGVKPPKRYKSEANFHVPYTATLLDNVWPLLTNKLPFAEVSPDDTARDAEAAKMMEELVRFTFVENKFENKFLMSSKESMMLNLAWTEVCWDYGKNADHPLIKPLNAMDVRVHRNKIYLDDRWPIFITSEMTKQQMLERGWDETSINKLSKSKLQTPQYRRSQRAAMGLSTTEDSQKNIIPADELYEVVEVWCKMKLHDDDKFERVSYIVMANDEHILNMKKDSSDFASPYEDYDEDMYPLAILPYNPIPHMFYPESFIDPIYDLQVELNALENMKADNYKRRNNPPLKVKRSGQVDLDSLQFVSGLPWLMEESDDVTIFEIPDLAQSIENQQKMVREQMQNRTGANDMLLVSDAQSMVGGDTALGASIANENTKMRFKPQANLIDDYIKRIGRLVINRWKQPEFFDRDRVFSITGDDGQAMEKTIGPKSIKGKYQFKVASNTSLAESDATKLQKFIQLKGVYAQENNAGLMDQIDQKIFEAAGLDYNKFKPNMDQSTEELSMTLEKLLGFAQSPDFKRRPVAVQQEILAQIQQIKATLSQTNPGGDMGGAGSPMDSQAQPAGPVPGPQGVGTPQPAPTMPTPGMAMQNQPMR